MTGSIAISVKKPQFALIDILRTPEISCTLSDSQWGDLLRQARALNVLGRVLQAIEPVFPFGMWPERLQQSYQSEKYISEHRHACLSWELTLLARQLGEIGIRPVLLKGAAYALSGFDFARFRAFGDIDILVPRSSIREVEKRLMISGWVTTKGDAYDQHYYRTWMHELPPMQHMHRGTSLDVHHSILPLTARYRPDPSLLFSQLRVASGLPAVDVLSPEDMFLHAAAHLFSESEDENAFRNLLDLRDLLALGVEQSADFIERVIERGTLLDLLMPLVLAGRYLERVFFHEASITLNRRLGDRMLVPRNISVWDGVFDVLFLAMDTSISSLRKAWARQVLFLRGHFLRMPLHLLVPHLVRKSLRPKELKK